MKIPVFILLALLTLLAGCAMPFGGSDSNPAPVSLARSFDANQVTRQQFRDKGVSIGGIVIRQGVTVHRYPDLPPLTERFDHYDQTEFWSIECERILAQKDSKLPVTPFFQFDDFVEDDLLNSMWDQYAQGGTIHGDLLNSVRAAQPGIQYVVMIRVDFDDVSRDINTSALMTQNDTGGLGKVRGVEHDPNQTLNSLHPTIKRVVGTTVTLYDLESARCIWEAGVVHDVSDSIDTKTMDDYSGFKAKQLETGRVVIEEQEEHLNAPAFSRVLDKCLNSLFSDMLKNMRNPDSIYEGDTYEGDWTDG